MSDTHAVTTIPVSRVCEIADCTRRSEVSVIVTGEYGRVTEAIGAYCEEHADKKDTSDGCRAIGEVTHE